LFLFIIRVFVTIQAKQIIAVCFCYIAYVAFICKSFFIHSLFIKLFLYHKKPAYNEAYKFFTV